jgi:hypothetical protein
MESRQPSTPGAVAGSHISLPTPADTDATERAITERGAAARRLKRELDDATATPIFIDYHLAPDWFEGVADILDALESHLAADPAAVLLLTEHATERLESAALDDSDGWLMQAFPRIEQLHAAAARHLALDPVTLAARLRSLAAASELEAFHNAPRTHAEALGERGLRALLRD